MSGDTANAHIWADADVYVSFDLAAPTPTDESTAFDTDFWELVGLLDGDQGFVESRNEDVADHFAWGGILMMTSRQHFKLTRTFTAFEDNATTQRLRWPGSSATELVVPRPERVLVAFETRSGDTVRRVITAYQAEVTPNGDLTIGEATPEAFPFLVTVYPDADGVLFTAQPAQLVSA